MLVDFRRESWLESASAVTLWELGLPVPTPQVVVLDAWDRFVGRVDVGWLDQGVVGEIDGRVKYDAALNGSAEAARRRLVAEKVREDRLRDLGLEVVRWGYQDLSQPHELAQRVVRALARGDRHRFRGRFVVAQDRQIGFRPVTPTL